MHLKNVVTVEKYSGVEALDLFKLELYPGIPTQGAFTSPVKVRSHLFG